MATRHKDWLRQAKRDLEHARRSLEASDYEWACFAAQQAAGKAAKSLYRKLRADAWGHAVAELLMNLPLPSATPPELIDRGRELDRHYDSARYPDLHPVGAPADLYTKAEAERALENANAIVAFCEDHLLR